MTDQPALAMQPLAQMPMSRSLKSQSGSSTADDQPDAQAAMRLRGGCGCDPCCGLCTLLMCFLCATADKKSGGGGGGTSDQVYYENKRNSGHYDPPYIPDAPNPPAPDTTDDSDGGAGRR